jgi:hypothetical protein
MRMRVQLSVLLAAVLWGCDSTGLSDDSALASVLGEITRAEARIAAGLFTVPAPEVGAGGAIPVDCPFVAVNASFVCTPSTSPGVSVSRSYQLLDANGSALAKFDRASVASIRVETSITATLLFSTGSLMYESENTLTLSGLPSGTHLINGQATTSSTTTWSGGSKTRTTTALQTITNVEPATHANTMGGFPTGGTVTSVVTGVDSTGIALPTTSVVTTFNGTNIVAVQVNQSGVTAVWQCQYSKASNGANLLACSKL